MTQCDDVSLRVRCLLCCKVIECHRSDTSPLLDHIRDSHPEVTLKQASEDLRIHRMKASGNKDRNSSKDPSLKADTTAQNDEINELNEASEVVKKEAIVDENSSNEGPELSKPPSEEPKQVLSSNNGILKNRLRAGTSCKCDPCHSKVDVARAGSLCSTVCQRKTKETQILYKRKYKVKKPISGHQLGKRKLYKTTNEKWKPGKSAVTCPCCGAQKKPIIKTQVDKVSHSPMGAAFILTCWPFCFLPCLFPPPTKELLHCSVCNHFLGVYDRKTEAVVPNEITLKKNQNEDPIDASETN